jgi:hypothetical protein
MDVGGPVTDRARIERADSAEQDSPEGGKCDSRANEGAANCCSAYLLGDSRVLQPTARAGLYRR